ncbi:MAG: hypothetical protein EA390_00910, partial [Balneolaceae bacterium]
KPRVKLGVKSGEKAQPRMGLNTKASELDQNLDVESRLKALVCSTPSGVANLAQSKQFPRSKHNITRLMKLFL